MKKELERILNGSAPLKFSEKNINWLIEHLGDLDSYQRDNLTYSLMAKGFLDNGFSKKQKIKIVRKVTQEKTIFSNIDQKENDEIFLRSFTALLGALILSSDTEDPFLSEELRNIWFNWSIEYLQKENDWRGFVKENGWAHAVAHGSDFLASAIAHPKFPASKIDEAFNVVRNVLGRIQHGFLDDEEERLANVIIAAIQTNKFNFSIYLAQTQKWLNNIDQHQNVDYYRQTTWKRILMIIYFLIPDKRKLIMPIIMSYYENNGYL